MKSTPSIYLDNHATTRVDPRVVEAMLPIFDLDYANAGSVTHAMGQRCSDLVESARNTIASYLGAANSSEIVFTSGATESNNLALRGFCQRIGSGHIISVQTEHQSVLATLAKLENAGFSITRLPVRQYGTVNSGIIEIDQLVDALRPDTILISVMLANNEIGAIHPVAQIREALNGRGIAIHCDATQAVGKMKVDVDQLGVDLLSMTAHKIHGPKGIGALYIRSQGRRVRLSSLIDGGSQEKGLRGGTQNVPGIVGFAAAVELCRELMTDESQRIAALRNRLFTKLSGKIGPILLNGPVLDDGSLRLAHNLNCQFPGLDGHSLMVGTSQLALSSGSACTATSTEPSHVLTALGLDRDQVRSSLRFGLSRFTTEQEIDLAVDLLAESAVRLRKLGRSSIA